MPLIDDWRVVLKHAWSVRLLALIVVVQGLEFALPLVGAGLPIPDSWLTPLTIVIGIAAALSRFIPQKSISGGGDADQ